MARLPPALLGPSLAENSEFQSALRPFFNIKLVKDRNFIPDVVLSAFGSEEVTLSAVWLEGAAAFQTPEAVGASTERVRNLVEHAKYPVVLVHLPISSVEGFLKFQTRIHDEAASGILDRHDSDHGVPFLMVLGLETLPEVFKLLKITTSVRQRERLQQHVARLREESCSVDAIVSLMQRGIPCCEAMTDLQFTLGVAGSICQLAAMNATDLVAATPLTETEAAALREFFDVESARL